MIGLKKKTEKSAITKTADRAAALQNIDALKGETERKRAELELKRSAAHALAQKKRVEFENARKNFVEAEAQHSKLMYQLDNLGFQAESAQNRIYAALRQGCSPMIEEFRQELMEELDEVRKTDSTQREFYTGRRNQETLVRETKIFTNVEQIKTKARIISGILQSLESLRMLADQSNENIENEIAKIRATIPVIGPPAVPAPVLTAAGLGAE